MQDISPQTTPCLLEVTLYRDSGFFFGYHETAVCVVRLPRREMRMSDEPYPDWSTMIDDIIGTLLPKMREMPFCFFGHRCVVPLLILFTLVLFSFASRIHNFSHVSTEHFHGNRPKWLPSSTFNSKRVFSKIERPIQ